MEFLRDEDIGKVDSLTQTSEDKGVIDSGAETESRLGDLAVELETPEAWLDRQDGSNKGRNGKRLRWLHIIGENRLYFKLYIREVYLIYNFRKEDPPLCCAPAWCNICIFCSHFLFYVKIQNHFLILLIFTRCTIKRV